MPLPLDGLNESAQGHAVPLQGHLRLVTTDADDEIEPDGRGRGVAGAYARFRGLGGRVGHFQPQPFQPERLAEHPFDMVAHHRAADPLPDRESEPAVREGVRNGVEHNPVALFSDLGGVDGLELAGVAQAVARAEREAGAGGIGDGHVGR